jgi:hypothetical protein
MLCADCYERIAGFKGHWSRSINWNDNVCIHCGHSKVTVSSLNRSDNLSRSDFGDDAGNSVFV